MSESLEIVEITDSSINIETSPELKSSSALQNTTKTKRQLEDSDELLNERLSKKICTKLEESVQITPIEINESAVVEESVVLSESKAGEDESELPEPDELNLNILDKSDDLLEEIDEEPATDSITESNNLPDNVEEEEEEIVEESFDYNDEDDEAEEEEEEDDNISNEDYDNSLMARALQASAKGPQSNYQLDDDGTIALDDSDDDAPHESMRNRKDSAESSDYSANNDVNIDSEDSDEEKRVTLLKRQIVKPHIQLARNLVKRSFRFLALRKLEGKRTIEPKEKKEVKELISEAKPAEEEANTIQPVSSVKATSVEKTIEADPMIANNGKLQEDEMMDVAEENEPVEETIQETPVVAEENKRTENLQNVTIPAQNEEKEEAPAIESDKADNTEKIEKPSENSSDSSRHESSLLQEIANASTEEIFNRYVVKNSEQSPTLDEFSEELFYCLQLNNIEIEKAKQLWNEKLHIKYKIRELMETIRRHRAVMEIEAFGYKPENSGSNSHPVVSSKSSTTNSETDNYEKHSRMSTESVNRLIQEVRATMLKRDDKHRNDDHASGSSEGTLAAQWNSLQSSTGRQGQIVDVQSIINDFRQKNPQEIPRRGRRMKNTFDGNYFENPQDDSRHLRKDLMSNVGNNSNDFSSTMKSNSGYPEVSLHPVQNLYKNISNASGSSSLQRSSLLQSILTKQSTKSPSGFHQSQQLPSTSTLARLLTAPERSFQGAPKQPPPRQSSSKSHNNGEITITPIGLNNSRNKEYPMDDDDNSLEPPLVIDEAEDFDAGERNAKSVSDLLCQGCKKNKAFFMCAGCSRQWYCSKECQEMAWDDHAESCMA